MPDATTAPDNKLPAHTGVGYKPQHYKDILRDPAGVRWFEVHAENYMGDGGRPIAQLRQLSERFPISVHGVGLSIGSDEALDREHLDRLKKLVDWLNPASFSEHLAWSSHGGTFFNDLLPLPYTEARLAKVADHVDEVQNRLGRRMLLENPSTYVSFADHEMSEIDFLKEVVARTGCGLLLDVNNVFVNCTNQGIDPYDYVSAFPLNHVGEIHLGGHDEDMDDFGQPLLIDSHNAKVVGPVWKLYAYTIRRAGPKPVLIEWDNDVPDWATLAGEASLAAGFFELEVA